MTGETSISIPNPLESESASKARLRPLMVADDIEAFVSRDRDANAGDIREPALFGINADGAGGPANWSLEFPDLDSYRKGWLGFARTSAEKSAPDRLGSRHHRASKPIDMQLGGDVATCLKSFANAFMHDDGSPEIMHWQTQYMCRRVQGKSNIWSFADHLPGRGTKPVIEWAHWFNFRPIGRLSENVSGR
ncbi:MAG: hypothetical protein OXC72_08925 [Roseovarius sp.]|nr:hypothetical protein [Roseovarius sp.]